MRNNSRKAVVNCAENADKCVIDTEKYSIIAQYCAENADKCIISNIPQLSCHK